MDLQDYLHRLYGSRLNEEITGIYSDLDRKLRQHEGEYVLVIERRLHEQASSPGGYLLYEIMYLAISDGTGFNVPADLNSGCSLGFSKYSSRGVISMENFPGWKFMPLDLYLNVPFNETFGKQGCFDGDVHTVTDLKLEIIVGDDAVLAWIKEHQVWEKFYNMALQLERVMMTPELRDYLIETGITHKIFISSPLDDNLTPDEFGEIVGYVDYLQRQGHEVYWPNSDSSLDDDRVGIINIENRAGKMSEASQIHVWYKDGATLVESDITFLIHRRQQSKIKVINKDQLRMTIEPSISNILLEIMFKNNNPN